MRIPPPGRFQGRDRERGAVLLVVALIGLGLISVSFMSISLGQAFLAQGQLQAAADAAARAAMIVLKSGRSRLDARDGANTMAAGARAVERPIILTSNDVEFGEFDHDTRQFATTVNGAGGEHAPAVRVRARRTAGSPGGPVDLALGGIFGQPQVEVQADAVASTGCREVVFAVDASRSMVDEIDSAYAAVEEFVLEMRRYARPGDKIGITTFAGDALSMRGYALDGGSYWSRPVPEELSAIPTDRADISAWVDAMRLEGNFCERIKDKLPTRGRGSCGGKGPHWGIYKAMEMFDRLDNRCSSPGERLIVLITDDIPCRQYSKLVGGNRRTRYYGGSVQEAYTAADAADSAGIHIAPILIDRGTDNKCRDDSHPYGQQPSSSQFIRNMERGSMAVSMIKPPDVNPLLDDLNGVLFVRLVD